MITAGLQGVDFVVANTDAQALTMSKAPRIIQMGTQVTQGLGAGSQPDVGAAAAQEVLDEIRDHLSGANMVFVTAGMRSEEHTSELQSQFHLVCRLLLEKKKQHGLQQQSYLYYNNLQ